jgi:ankyrin repeat protein
MGYLSIVVMLLHAMKCMSSTVDDYVYEGATPLFIAAQNGHTEIITVLFHNISISIFAGNKYWGYAILC